VAASLSSALADFSILCVQLYSLLILEDLQDADNAVHTWIAAWSQHTVYALAGLIELLGKGREGNCCVDIITKHSFADTEIPSRTLLTASARNA
jgi:hypothetical protein